ncbi:MAG: hypothetical protein GX801_04305 [Fibrobacter sp.]|nr:hypothetical protein [Fibrobacter sp.]
MLRKKILAAFLASFLFWSCSSGDSVQNAGTEIGNPMVSMSARFSLAPGEAYFDFLGKVIAMNVDSVQWQKVSFNLKRVSYFGSYYYYIPIDASVGTILWPKNEEDPSVQIDLLNGDSLEVNFQNINIPSRSYLKEVGLLLDLSKQEFVSHYIPLDAQVKIILPDSLTLRLRYHHAQIINDLSRSSEEESPKYDLSVLFHPETWLKTVDFSNVEVEENQEIIISETSNADLLDSLVAYFPKAFNATRYQMIVGGEEKAWEIQDWAVKQFDKPNGERVKNGDFKEFGNSWVFLTQLDGVADTMVNDNKVKISVHEPGTHDYSVQWMQEDIEIVQGRCYELSFEAWSDVEQTNILTRLGRYMAPYDNLDHGNMNFRIHLQTTPTKHSLQLCAKETTPFGRLEFNLGLWKRTVWLRNISLVQLP